MGDSSAMDETQVAEDRLTDPSNPPDPSHPSDSSSGDSTGPMPRGPGGGFRVGAIDADRLRSAVASRLFGVEAEPVKIGRFTILSRLGAGGMGVVYSAYDDQLDRKLAIKLLRGEASEQRRARLMREAQALARVSHPNVIHVYEVGTFREQVFVAMEFVRGRNLEHASEDLPEAERVGKVLRWFEQAGEGLAAAHTAGLIHRDFKPENCLVGDDDRVRVLDFGLARAAGERMSGDGNMDSDSLDDDERAQVQARLAGSSDSLDAPLTRTGAIMGTPAYMAPEQHLGGEVDARTDQFSFCVSLWECLYGERPFAGDTLAQLSLAVTGGKLRSVPASRGVPKWVHRALVRGLSVHPEDRWPDMQSLLAALSPERRRRRRWIIAAGLAGVATVGIAAAGALWKGPGPCEGSRAELDGIWDAGARSKVRAAFEATGAPFSADAYRGTAETLDGYTERWVGMHRDACVAAMVDKRESPELFGRKMVCLGQRLAEVEAFTQELLEVDTPALGKVTQAAGELGDLESCADAAALASVDASLDDATRAKVDGVERTLARGQTKFHLGRYTQALEIAREAVDEARILGRARLEARALLLLGKVQGELWELDAAVSTLREALRRADVARDDTTRVETWIWLLQWIGYQQRNFEEAEEIAADARAALERLGDAPLLRADLEARLGSIAAVQGKLDEAITHHRNALDTRIQELGERSVEVAKSRNNLGNALLHSGEHEAAAEELRQALAGFEEVLGKTHPYVVTTLGNLGAALSAGARSANDPGIEAQRYAEAEALYRRAIEVSAAAFGPEHPAVARSFHNLGETLRREGRAAEGLEQLDRALELKRAVLGDDHVSVATTRCGRGAALVELGRSEEAVEALEAALAIYDLPESGVTQTDRSECVFALARAKGHGAGNELARDALAGFEAAGASWGTEAERVRTWLRNE